MPAELDSTTSQIDVRTIAAQREEQTHEVAAQQESATTHGENASDELLFCGVTDFNLITIRTHDVYGL